MLLPLLSPLHVAEEFATLDGMSDGKITLGAGLDYRNVEFTAFGVPRNERARRFEAPSTRRITLGSELPPDDTGFDQDFEALIGNHFLIGFPDEAAEQILALRRIHLR